MVVPFSTLDALQFGLQLLVLFLLGSDLFGDFVAVRGIQLVDELGDEMLVLQRLLHGRQRRSGLLPLPRIGGISIGFVAAVALLVLDLAPQTLEIEVAQGIRTQTAALKRLVASDVGVLLQHVRDATEDGITDAIGTQTLEQ
jgi:hypothetical protein